MQMPLAPRAHFALVAVAALAALGAFALALGACSRAPSEPTTTSAASSTTKSISPPSPGSAKAPPMDPSPSSTPRADALALAWTDPPAWKRRPPSTPMRKAEYLVPRAGSDTDDAECTVITFGGGQGGSVEQNIDRWKAQFEGAADPKSTKRDVAGMHVTTLEVAGTFNGGGMPGGAAAPAKSGYRMLASVVEAPDGMWFFKLTGPDATVKAASAAFAAMITSSHGAS